MLLHLKSQNWLDGNRWALDLLLSNEIGEMSNLNGFCTTMDAFSVLDWVFSSFALSLTHLFIFSKKYWTFTMFQALCEVLKIQVGANPDVSPCPHGDCSLWDRIRSPWEATSTVQGDMGTETGQTVTSCLHGKLSLDMLRAGVGS